MHNELLQATCNKEFEFTRIFLERRTPPKKQNIYIYIYIYIYMYVSVYYIKI